MRKDGDPDKIRVRGGTGSDWALQPAEAVDVADQSVRAQVQAATAPTDGFHGDDFMPGVLTCQFAPKPERHHDGHRDGQPLCSEKRGVGHGPGRRQGQTAFSPDNGIPDFRFYALADGIKAYLFG